MTTVSFQNACLKEVPDLTAIPYEVVNLRGNRLRSLQGLPRTIKELDVSFNSLYSDTLDDPLILLERLSIHHNHLCIPSTGEFLLLYPMLKFLDISCNSLQVVGFLRDSQIEELLVSRNKLHLLSALPLTLKKLVADTNTINMIQSKLPPLLESMDVSYNLLRFAGLPLSWPMALKELHLDHNRIEKFPRKLPDSLEILTLNENRITELPKKLPEQLRVFSVSSNRIRFLPNYKSHKKFQVFLINDNCLTEIPQNTHATVFSAEENWTTQDHATAQTILKRCWKRHVITLRLRHIVRTQVYKEELFMVSMMPERWDQVDVLDPVWFRKSQDHNRTGHLRD